MARWGDLTEDARTIDRDECWALRRGRAYVVGKGDAGPRCGHLEGRPGIGSICVPMSAQANSLGLLHVTLGPDQEDTGPHVLDSKRKLAVTVAEQLSLALANLSLRESLQRESATDALTGLFNCRYMEHQLAHEIARAARTGSSVGVVVADVDHLERYNAEAGHALGEEVLRSLARTLEGAVREGDILCRAGGDEFVVVLVGSGVSVAYQRAEQIQAELVRRQHARAAALPPVALSVGVAAFPDHGRTAHAVLRAAETGLYAARQAGGNQVVGAGEVLERSA